MLKSDYHIHTNFSGDATGTMEAMVQSAIAKGFSEIAFTDHVDHNAIVYAPIDFDCEKYMLSFSEMQKKYEGQIRLILGLEIGLAPNLVKEIEMTLAKAPFDFVIGSSHDIHGKELYLGDYFDGKTKKEAYRAYFEEILTNCRLFSNFSVYGHLDYISRYGNYADNSLLYEDYRDIIDDILTVLIETGRGLEVNTSGYRYGLNQVHPNPCILKRYRELGGDIVTVGSDAHRPKDIGEHFDLAIEFIKAAGFKAVTVFRNMEPIWRDI